MGITYCITRPERKRESEMLPLCTYWWVQLTDIELEETESGKRLKWVFQTPDKQHTIVGYTKFSTWYRSKCTKWVRAVMNKNHIPPRPFDLKELIGNKVGCCVEIVQKKDGTKRYIACDLYNTKV